MTGAVAGTGSRRDLVIVADDYGLAPGVSAAIRTLIAAGKLSGTGCMPLFDDWIEEAKSLGSTCETGRAEAGLHLTLTDFKPLSGHAPLGGERMPAIRTLLKENLRGRVDEAAVAAELDAQLDAFREGMGRMPTYIDGHQHVHFMSSVRDWLVARAPLFRAEGRMPWLRGAPSVALSPGLVLKAKTGVVAALASGFDRQMRRAGYEVKGPLTGFYDWNVPGEFEPMIRSLSKRGLKRGVVMCHPGFIDEKLRRRDTLIDARETEFQVLSGLEPIAG